MLLTKRSTRLLVFGTVTVALAALATTLVHNLLWEVGMSPDLLWSIFLSTNFQVSLVPLCVLLVWLSAILIWSADNLFKAARLQRGR